MPGKSKVLKVPDPPIYFPVDILLMFLTIISSPSHDPWLIGIARNPNSFCFPLQSALSMLLSVGSMENCE